MDLYSYCLRYDDGAAPNPYWGVCTLNICKPAIRRTASVGDWIVGTGSSKVACRDGAQRDLSGHVIYAMKVTEKLTMKQYDQRTAEVLKDKRPDWRNADHVRRLGDSIYDFTKQPPLQRPGVHRAENVQRDLSGEYALLSTHFFYFGDRAVQLPGSLSAIAVNQQGHRRGLNASYVHAFVTWIEGLGHEPCAVLGRPLLDLFESDSPCSPCASGRVEDDESDEIVSAPC